MFPCPLPWSVMSLSQCSVCMATSLSLSCLLTMIVACFYLIRRKTGFTETDNLVVHLIKCSIESAAGPMVVALINLVLNGMSNETQWFLFARPPTTCFPPLRLPSLLPPPKPLSPCPSFSPTLSMSAVDAEDVSSNRMRCTATPVSRRTSACADNLESWAVALKTEREYINQYSLSHAGMPPSSTPSTLPSSALKRHTSICAFSLN